MKKTKTKQNFPTGELMALMVKLNVDEKTVLKIGQEIVIRSKKLFEKWKTNYLSITQKSNNFPRNPVIEDLEVITIES